MQWVPYRNLAIECLEALLAWLTVAVLQLVNLVLPPNYSSDVF